METTIIYLGLYWDNGREKGNCYSILGLYRDNGKKMETTIVHCGHIGIMEKKTETTIIYWGYIGIIEKKVETTTVHGGCIGIVEMKMETITVGLCKAYATGNMHVSALVLLGSLLGIATDVQGEKGSSSRKQRHHFCC